LGLAEWHKVKANQTLPGVERMVRLQIPPTLERKVERPPTAPLRLACKFIS